MKIWIVQPNGTSLSWWEVPDDTSPEEVRYQQHFSTSGYLKERRTS